MNKKIKKIILCLILSFAFLPNIKAAYSDSGVKTYEEELAKFPSDYKTKIEALNIIYPNAIFVAQDTFFDWNQKEEIAVSWSNMYSAEKNTSSKKNMSLISTYDGYKETASWAYNYYTDKFTNLGGTGWHAANYEAIAYYLDPRNFLTEKSVFMFESLFYKDFQTQAGVEKILDGTFMENKVPSGESKKYSQIIIEAAKTNDISPYFLASRLRQEQGSKGTSSLISGKYSGYTGYYNYFNIGASGKTDSEVILNGLKKAKSEGWSSVSLSITGGAKFVKDEYVGINDKFNVRGQMTNYLQKWDPYGPKLGGHQYMQNIVAPVSEASTTFNSYASTANYKNFKYVFHIPVYSKMPLSTPLPNSGNPNNYLKYITVNGYDLSGFDGAKTSYSMNVSSITTSLNIDAATVNKYADYTIDGKDSDNKAVNITSDNQTITVKAIAQNGATKTYTIKITRDSKAPMAVSEIINAMGNTSDGTYIGSINLNTTANALKDKVKKITSLATVKVTSSSNEEKTTDILKTGDKLIITSGSETKTYLVVIKGDANGDGKINAQDYVKIKNHIMQTSSLSSAYKQAADVDRNNSISAVDYVKVKNYIMGNGTITQ